MGTGLQVLRKCPAYRTKKFMRSASSEIFKSPVPNLGFRVMIPSVGRIEAGAFVSMDWVAEMDVGPKFVASFNPAHEIRHRVDARIIPPNLRTTKLGPSGTARPGGTLTSHKRSRPGLELLVLLVCVLRSLLS